MPVIQYILRYRNPQKLWTFNSTNKKCVILNSIKSPVQMHLIGAENVRMYRVPLSFDNKEFTFIPGGSLYLEIQREVLDLTWKASISDRGHKMSGSKCIKQPRKNYAKEQQEMTHSEKLRLIDDELNSFYKYCQQAGFTEEEMDIICQPLVAAMRRSWLQLVFRGTLILIVLGTLACLAAQLDFVGTHFTALSRLLLIKVLPIWNWQPLYYENCMINNPFYNDYTITEEDCVTCEALETIDRLSDVRYRNLVDNYLSRDAPAIITDAMDSWAVMNTDYFWFDNITHLYLENERLMETVPCALTSNLRTGSSDLAAFLRRVHSPEVAKWFVHWQNCDINAVKVLRKYYQRPYFLSSTVSPAHFNWVLMSSDYNSPSYKKVELDSGLIALAQLRGATQLRLTPINPCNSSCPELIADLHQGEMLVFTNLMWTLEYAPMRGLDNIAILTETVWEEDT